MSGPRVRLTTPVLLCLCLSLLLQRNSGVVLPGIFLRFDQLALLAALPLSLVLASRPSARKSPRSWSAVVFAIAVMSVTAVTVLKGNKYAEWNQIKNILVMIALSYTATLSVLRIRGRVEPVLTAICIGAAGSILIVVTQTDFAAGLVRPLSDSAFREEIGVSYLWLGLAGAIGLLVSLQLRRTMNGMGRLIGTVGASACAAGIIIGGSRSVVFVLAAVPLVIILLRRVQRAVLQIGVALVFASWAIVSIAPAALLNLLPGHASSADTRGLARLADSRSLLVDVEARVADWDRMLYDRSIEALLFGSDWDVAVANSVVLSHPHNVVVWSQLLWGAIGTLLLGTAYSLVFYASISAYRQSGVESRKWYATLVFGHLLIVGVLLTNSWIWGAAQLLGMWSALTVFSVQQSRGVATAGMRSPVRQARAEWLSSRYEAPTHRA